MENHVNNEKNLITRELRETPISLKCFPFLPFNRCYLLFTLYLHDLHDIYMISRPDRNQQCDFLGSYLQQHQQRQSVRDVFEVDPQLGSDQSSIVTQPSESLYTCTAAAVDLAVHCT